MIQQYSSHLFLTSHWPVFVLESLVQVLSTDHIVSYASVSCRSIPLIHRTGLTGHFLCLFHETRALIERQTFLSLITKQSLASFCAKIFSSSAVHRSRCVVRICQF